MAQGNFQRLGDAADQVVQRLRRQHRARRIHALGDRPLFEMLEEVRELFPHFLRAELDALFDRYVGLDAAVVQALGADRLVSPPLHVVRHGGGTR
jgi:hypothetical protein